LRAIRPAGGIDQPPAVGRDRDGVFHGRSLVPPGCGPPHVT
jgi:hypothetical protein